MLTHRLDAYHQSTHGLPWTSSPNSRSRASMLVHELQDSEPTQIGCGPFWEVSEYRFDDRDLLDCGRTSEDGHCHHWNAPSAEPCSQTHPANNQCNEQRQRAWSREQHYLWTYVHGK